MPSHPIELDYPELENTPPFVIWLDCKVCLHNRFLSGDNRKLSLCTDCCRAERNSPDCSPSSDRPDCSQCSICCVYQYDDTCACVCVCACLSGLSVGVWRVLEHAAVPLSLKHILQYLQQLADFEWSLLKAGLRGLQCSAHQAVLRGIVSKSNRITFVTSTKEVVFSPVQCFQ